MPFMTDVLSPGGSEGDILDNLKINPDTIAISGFSSGGYFSTQFHVAFSKKVMNFKVDFFLNSHICRFPVLVSLEPVPTCLRCPAPTRKTSMRL